ncbi:uncharacterized protein MONOS_9454 [Monocercomonoides exilis]|uniref:uncharacterized protein n=1 Tax=Monocercomonoides exilis TaxID=2049356 RepID=UPI00355AC794|nr:hypothetical protein MONOS_9454 [Monocercomonoides exilis]|eukprot:MONOS_9454.1-p1 / transcript=MONOS_9454.1 / gene=MONOS_9454 / organism=Monocercomonoides_exilis_PA203 / gene_product=unspecified product / transcript_product=unspecified product / location=Mono_scaffold00391:18844-21564(-) / protein_length=694 / sequence_SO=supercontig / SO=protein_coding / is_pseudo=false
MTEIPTLESVLSLVDSPSYSEDLRAGIFAGVTNLFNKPPWEQASTVLGQNLTPERTKQMIFAPVAQDMLFYPILISSPPGNDRTHPMAKTQIPFITMLYLVHSKNWNLVRPFIVAGGLRVLVSLFTCPVEQIRGQALEIFLQISSEEVFDWFSDENVQKDMLVLTKMRDLCNDGIIYNLLSNAKTHASWQALQALAFWVSFIRFRFTRNRILRFSKGLLNAIRDWKSGDENDDATKKAEEELRRNLYEDFSRFPLETTNSNDEKKKDDMQRKKQTEKTDEKSTESTTNDSKSEEPVTKIKIEAELDLTKDQEKMKRAEERRKRAQEMNKKQDGQQDHPYPPPSFPAESTLTAEPLPTPPSLTNTPSSYKEQGNKLFQKGKLDDALVMYSRGLEVSPIHPYVLSCEMPPFPSLDKSKQYPYQQKDTPEVDDSASSSQSASASASSSSSSSSSSSTSSKQPSSQYSIANQPLSSVKSVFSEAGVSTYLSLRLNRSLCLLQLSMRQSIMSTTEQDAFDRALLNVVEDTTVVLTIDPSNAKAWYRRAKAFHLLQMDEEAYRDIRKAHELGESEEIDQLLKQIEGDIHRTRHPEEHEPATVGLTFDPSNPSNPFTQLTEKERREREERARQKSGISADEDDAETASKIENRFSEQTSVQQKTGRQKATIEEISDEEYEKEKAEEEKKNKEKELLKSKVS